MRIRTRSGWTDARSLTGRDRLCVVGEGRVPDVVVDAHSPSSGTHCSMNFTRSMVEPSAAVRVARPTRLATSSCSVNSTVSMSRPSRPLSTASFQDCATAVRPSTNSLPGVGRGVENTPTD
jgi:hypothetical protein